MAVYESLSWQEDDEVTSEKLNKMTQNEQWLKDKMIIGGLHVRITGAGTLRPDGYTPGTYHLKTMEHILHKFDSGVPVKTYDFNVEVPNVFKGLPGVLVTLKGATFNGHLQVRSIAGGQCTLRATETHGVAVRMIAVAHVLFIGPS